MNTLKFDIAEPIKYLMELIAEYNQLMNAPLSPETDTMKEDILQQICQYKTENCIELEHPLDHYLNARKDD